MVSSHKTEIIHKFCANYFMLKIFKICVLLCKCMDWGGVGWGWVTAGWGGDICMFFRKLIDLNAKRWKIREQPQTVNITLNIGSMY